MYTYDDFRSALLAILSNTVFLQIAPLLIIIVFPFLVLTLASRFNSSRLLWSAAMVLESLGLGLPWSWSGGHAGGSGLTHEKRKKKKLVRTRGEQIAMNGSAKEDLVREDEEEDGHYPGLVNISGTYCFMNSTLQAMSSLSYLQPHIDAIHAKAEVLDVPSPVTDALQDILHTLNTPNSSYVSVRPVDIIDALANHSAGKINSLFSSREHQDAQELFQLLSECIKSESAAVDKEGYRDRGLGGLAQTNREGSREIGKSPFDGLTANRRSCMECGYTEAVIHFAFDNWQLAVPRLVASCQLEDCLADYTRLELLTDCICRKCSLLATHRRLAQEAEKVSEAVHADKNVSSSKKKRAREARKLEARVKQALETGRIEEDLKSIKMEKVISKASTKQAMIARPPPILALHLNRSMHYGQYASKNNVRVIFPEILDLTPFTTSGNLSTVPSVPISTPPPLVPRSTTPTPATYATPRTIYRLAAVVCHYGQHSFGHYICYRRKPRPPSAGVHRFDPPKFADFFGCECKKCERLGPVRDNDEPTEPGHGWLRVSDDSVRECGIETVLLEGSGAFMLYYERVVHAGQGVYPLRSPRGSEETLKPGMMRAHTNGSSTSLSSVEESRMGRPIEEKAVSKTLGPRVVRSVAAGRGRSQSAAPSERDSIVSPATGDFIPKRGLSPVQNNNAHVLDEDASGHVASSAAMSLSLPSPTRPPFTSPSPSISHPPLPLSPQHRIQSPEPIHQPSSVAHVVGLTA